MHNEPRFQHFENRLSTSERFAFIPPFHHRLINVLPLSLTENSFSEMFVGNLALAQKNAASQSPLLLCTFCGPPPYPPFARPDKSCDHTITFPLPFPLSLRDIRHLKSYVMARIHSAETGCVYIFQLPLTVSPSVDVQKSNFG